MFYFSQIIQHLLLLFQTSFSLKFNVKLHWNDYRLEFQNLKENHFQNQLSDDMALNLWVPQPVFENSYHLTSIQYIPSVSFIMIVKNGSSQESPLTQLEEARISSSRDTKLFMKTNHFLSFKCDYNLRYFPFDYQICYMKVICWLLRWVKFPKYLKTSS